MSRSKNKTRRPVDESGEVIHAIRPNKTQLKVECDEMHKMGEELIALKSVDLDKIHLPEDLEKAIHEARKIKSKSGSKRQRQFIGKLIRSLDHDDISKQLEKIKHIHDTSTASFKKTELWRDRLLSDEHDAVTEIINVYPNIDRQHINQLVRQALLEKNNEKPPVAARKLFKYLREIEEN
jgi:ribosome-associated protein